MQQSKVSTVRRQQAEIPRSAIEEIAYVNICGAQIHRLSLAEVVQRIENHLTLDHSIPQYVVTPNAQHIVLLNNDAEFRRIYEAAFLRVPDGVSLLWAAQFLGTPLKGRVNGTDLFERLSELSAKKGLRIYLLGGRPRAAESAAKVLMKRHPCLKVAGVYCPSYGFEKNPKELQMINQRIRTASPDLLFVGLGAPKQEKWISENLFEIDVPIAVGIGGSFEMVSGMTQRAPFWMQSSGLEWLFRLGCEPKRLWKRYLFGIIAFLWLVARQRAGQLSIN